MRMFMCKIIFISYADNAVGKNCYVPSRPKIKPKVDTKDTKNTISRTRSTRLKFSVFLHFQKNENMLGLLSLRSLSFSLYLSSQYDRRHRSFFGNIWYEGSDMILGWFIRLYRWLRFFFRTGRRTDGRTNKGVPRSSRRPKNGVEGKRVRIRFAEQNCTGCFLWLVPPLKVLSTEKLI